MIPNFKHLAIGIGTLMAVSVGSSNAQVNVGISSGLFKALPFDNIFDMNYPFSTFLAVDGHKNLGNKGWGVGVTVDYTLMNYSGKLIDDRNSVAHYDAYKDHIISLGPYVDYGWKLGRNTLKFGIGASLMLHTWGSHENVMHYYKDETYVDRNKDNYWAGNVAGSFNFRLDYLFKNGITLGYEYRHHLNENRTFGPLFNYGFNYLKVGYQLTLK